MTKLLIVFTMTLLLSACGGPHQHQLQITGFEPYVQEFEQMSIQYAPKPIVVDDLIIQFGNAAVVCAGGENTVGCCIQEENTTPTITVDNVNTDYMDDPVFFEVMMMHEMGHCVLGRVHNPAMMPAPNQGDSASIMNPYINPVDLDAFRSQYFTEYFNWQ